MMPAANLNIFIAFGAGLVSFVSPCVLPLVPSYISFIGGQGLSELRDGGQRRMALLGKTLFFVLGFSLVFVLMGILLSGTAAAFSGANRIINIAAGSIVLLFGANLLFNFISFLNYEKRFHLTSRPAGVLGSSLLGMAFAAGWSPCIGPILASILALAASGSSVAGGAALLGFYSLGLALPFLLTSLFLSRAEAAMKRIKPHMMTIQRVSGVILIIIGVLMIFGQYARITNWLIQASFRLRAWDAANPVTGRVVFSRLFLGIGAAIGAPLLGRRIHRRPGAGSGGESDNAETAAADQLSASTPGRQGPAAIISRTIFTLLFMVPGALAALGLVNLPAMIASWLSFQGI
jgi:cytochrome c-type biogenesis protein